jgi:hypothetical protein
MQRKRKCKTTTPALYRFCEASVVATCGAGQSLRYCELRMIAGRVAAAARLACARKRFFLMGVAMAGTATDSTQFNQTDRYEALCFGPPAKPSYKRWKKPLERIMSWERFNPECAMTVEQIDEWIKSMRHKVMYRDESKIE